MACAVASCIGLALVGSGALIGLADGSRGGLTETTGTVSGFEEAVAGRAGPSRVLVVAFTDEGGVQHTARIEIGRSTDAPAVGVTVAVSYDPTDPDDASLTDHPPSSALVPWFVPFAAGLGVLCLVGLIGWRLRRLARVLRDNPWVVAESRVVELALDTGGRAVLRMLELVGAPDEGTVLAAPVALRAQLIDQLAPRAWIAGSDRFFVAAAPGGGNVLRMRRIRMTGRQLEGLGQAPLWSRFDGG